MDPDLPLLSVTRTGNEAQGEAAPVPSWSHGRETGQAFKSQVNRVSLVSQPQRDHRMKGRVGSALGNVLGNNLTNQPVLRPCHCKDLFQ